MPSTQSLSNRSLARDPARGLSARAIPIRPSTHGKALSGSIKGQGCVPFASRNSRSAMVRSARCKPARNTQGVSPTRSVALSALPSACRHPWPRSAHSIAGVAIAAKSALRRVSLALCTTSPSNASAKCRALCRHRPLLPQCQGATWGELECRASDFAAAAGPADPRPRLRRPEWCRSVPGRKLVPGSIRSSAEIVPRSKAQGRALADRQIWKGCVGVQQQK